ncbi:MAG: nucleoside monophosphate kinase [Patescibacteria group bacterium]|nr:nucleoside monophosphate kinase [Patescibacteria group bacterium]
MPKAIMVMGPPGSGKGTQAQFIADTIGATHYDTGARLRELIAAGEVPDGNYNTGKLVDPFFVAKTVIGDITALVQKGESIVFSGSPRSLEEAFGDESHQGLIDLLGEQYGMEGVVVFLLNIPVEESIKRNTKRGRDETDSAQIIPIRYEEMYKQRIVPAVEEMRRRGYKIIEIDGMPALEAVSASIKPYLKE